MPYTPQEAADKASFVQFAYNMYGSGSNLNPPPDPGIAQNGYNLVLNLTAKDLQSTKFYGYIAASTTNPGDLLLVIRGTETAAEWLLDFSALPLPFLDQGLVAAGFRSIAESIALNDSTGASSGLTQAITQLAAKHPITSLTILGHSLGAALATLAAAELASTNPASVKPFLSLWTYASPRVGLPDFMNKFNAEVPNTYRIWNSLDIVPGVPVFPYVHIGGSGEELKQSEAQMTEIVYSPGCEHHLSTYQWLLDATDFKLECDCDNDCPPPAAAAVGAPQVGVVAPAMAAGLPVRSRVAKSIPTTAERAQGAHALFEAMQAAG